MLEEDRHAAMVAMLEGREDVPSDEESQPVEEESGASEDQAVEEVEEEETVVDAASDEDEYEPQAGHRVPYERFKQVNDNRRQLQAQLEEQERIIAEFKNKKSQQPEPEDSYSYSYDDDDSDESPGYDDELSYLRHQTQEMQVKFAAMELQKEITAAMQEHPNVPEDYIWETIAQDGNLSASDVAAQYSNWVAEVEEAAIARYLESQGQSGSSAPPRPSKKQTAKSNPGAAEEWQPRNTDEAREAMIAYLRS